jgi:hypothetical protein
MPFADDHALAVTACQFVRSLSLRDDVKEDDRIVIFPCPVGTLQDPRVRNVPVSPTVSILFCLGLSAGSMVGRNKYLICLGSNGAAGVD